MTTIVDLAHNQDNYKIIPKQTFVDRIRTFSQHLVKHHRKLVVLTCFLILMTILIKMYFSDRGIFGFGAPDIQQTDGYTNILLLGLDRRAEDTKAGGLNDTIIVASFNRSRQQGYMVTIPRDLWVSNNGDYSGKVNGLYSYGGIEETTQMVSKILGIPIHYYVVIDFEGFTKAIDALGGVDVYVEREFDDYLFPIDGKESAPNEADRYEHLHFNKGWQHMDGQTALKFARSRHAEGEEGSDFARSQRQQKVIIAAKEKAISLNTLSNPIKIKELYSVFARSIETDVTVVETQLFIELIKSVGNDRIVSSTIDHTLGDQRLLYTPPDSTPFGGAWVLVPTIGDFSDIQKYVSSLLKSSAE